MVEKARELRVLLPPTLGRSGAEGETEKLREQLGAALELAVSVEVASDYRALAWKTMRGAADVTWAPPQLCHHARERSRRVLRAVRNAGSTTYQAALLVRAGTAQALEALAGKRAAWVSADSTAGYLLARDLLRARGINPDRFFSRECFHGSYRDALLSVVREEDDMCSIYTSRPEPDAVAVSIAEQVGSAGTDLQPLAYTPTSRNDGLVVMQSIDEATAQRVVALLLSDACPPALLATCNAEAFTPDDEQNA